MTTLIIDNYDSFTYNLYQLLSSVSDESVIVIKNDDVAGWAQLDFASINRMVVSPGPGRPDRSTDFGLSRVALESRLTPVLGVCLGHQGLCALSGAQIVRAPEPVHGRISSIIHSGDELFSGIPSPFDAVRYHSLIAIDLPPELDVIASTAEGLIMAVRHTEWPAWGVQFHPESICTEHGRRLLENFVAMSGGTLRGDRQARLGKSQRTQHSKGLRARWVQLDHFPDPASAIDVLFAESSVAFWLDTPGTAFQEGRYSYIGGSGGPLATIVSSHVDDGHVVVQSEQDGRTSEPGSILDYLDRHLANSRVAEAAPFPLNLGYVGWFGYELKSTVGGDRRHTAPHSDALFVRADRLLVLDHRLGLAWLATLEDDATSDLAGEWRRWAIGMLAAVTRRSRRGDRAEVAVLPSVDYRLDLREYEEKIIECQRLIRAGETYEICLTNMLSVGVKIDPLKLFAILRNVNPAPFAAYIRTPSVAVVGSSPERFLAVENDTVFSKPMKGTRRRGSSEAEDLHLRDDLRLSEKDRAENLMITDLVRNDFGKIAEPGSVVVDDLFRVETFESAHQMTTRVSARLPPAASIVDCIRAAFPPGSMTGAPKKRTMEILDELEGGPRGIYSGALGFLTLDGRLDLAVVIRTMIVTSDRVEIGVGGAITALSDPKAEVEEMLLKASALISAIGVAASEPDTNVSAQ